MPAKDSRDGGRDFWLTGVWPCLGWRVAGNPVNSGSAEDPSATVSPVQRGEGRVTGGALTGLGAPSAVVTEDKRAKTHTHP